MPYWLALKAEVLNLADRTSEALEAMEAEALVVRTEQRWWCAELHRLHGAFLATMGAFLICCRLSAPVGSGKGTSQHLV